MSKRFGRNQRRKMREEIARKTEAHERASALASYQSDIARRLEQELRDWDDEITHLLGVYSAFRRTTPDLSSRHPLREMPIEERLSFAQAWREVDLSVMMQPIEMMRVRMFRFLTSIDQEPVRMNWLIRLIETNYHEATVGYSMADPLWRHGGFGPRDVDWLARDIARKMKLHIDEKVHGKRRTA